MNFEQQAKPVRHSYFRRDTLRHQEDIGEPIVDAFHALKAEDYEGLMHWCIRVVEQLPEDASDAFKQTLPFTEIELESIKGSKGEADTVLRPLIDSRFRQFVRDGSVDLLGKHFTAYQFLTTLHSNAPESYQSTWATDMLPLIERYEGRQS